MSLRRSSFSPLRKVGARRARRHPPSAKGSAVGAARRLRCDARSGVVRPNSLRSLRSLRSDRRRKSDHEARAARAPTPPLRFSPPLNSPRAGAACRDDHCSLSSGGEPRLSPQRAARAVRSAIGRRRGRTQAVQWTACACRGVGSLAQRGLQGRASQQARPRAYPRASSSCSSRLSERSERSERSELGDGPRLREAQGSRCLRHRPPGSRAAGCPGSPLRAQTVTRQHLLERTAAMRRKTPS